RRAAAARAPTPRRRGHWRSCWRGRAGAGPPGPSRGNCKARESAPFIIGFTPQTALTTSKRSARGRGPDLGLGGIIVACPAIARARANEEHGEDHQDHRDPCQQDQREREATPVHAAMYSPAVA